MNEPEANNEQLRNDVYIYVNTLDLYERTVGATEGHVPQMNDLRGMLEKALSNLRRLVDLADEHRRALEDAEARIPGLSKLEVAQRRAELDARLNELKTAISQQ